MKQRIEEIGCLQRSGERKGEQSDGQGPGERAGAGGALCGERGPLGSQGLHVDGQSTGAGEEDSELVWGRIRGKWQKLKIHFPRSQP